ncbi:MAG: HEAT repeat domain-containing protein [Proteobacteria bacterium]|nr:HEAT repeat domain-containing protein [Pseudomonadota bacterium]
MSLKVEFVNFVKDTLQIPLVGIAPPDNFSPEDVERISPVLHLFSRSTPLAAGAESVLHAQDFLTDARSVIVTGTPYYFGMMPGVDECRSELRGRAEPSHVNIKFSEHNMQNGQKLTEFFAGRGFQCFPAVGMQFPVKRAAAQCGVGFYGKNAIIQHPGFGSWISLMAYISDAPLEPDEPLKEECGSCELCLNACPTGALYAPYRCDAARCLDFQLGHNKLTVPFEIRGKCGNLLGEGCTACRDICPKNKKLKQVQGFEIPQELLSPSLLRVFDITDDEWDAGYAMTLMGFFLMDKKYLQRNAAIGLGNFKDERALDVLARVFASGPEEVRGYAAWALGSIGGGRAKKILKSALDKEQHEQIRKEIESAVEAA